MIEEAARTFGPCRCVDHFKDGPSPGCTMCYPELQSNQMLPLSEAAGDRDSLCLLHGSD